MARRAAAAFTDDGDKTSEPKSNTNRASLLEFADRMDDAVAVKDAAVAGIKNLRTIIKGAGFDLAAFDLMMKKRKMSHEAREKEDTEYRRYMNWMGMPVGSQAEMFPNGPEDDLPPEIQVKRVHQAGVIAGKAGHEDSMNPWPVGGMLHQEWRAGWGEGREAAAQSTVKETQKAAETAATGKRGRGRPRKGSVTPPPDPAFPDAGKDPDAAEAAAKDTGEGPLPAVTPETRRGADLDFDADSPGVGRA